MAISKKDNSSDIMACYGQDAASRRDIEKQNRDLVRKTLELTELKGELEDKNYELQEIYKSIKKQNKELTKKTIELTELKGELEEKNLELEIANKKISKNLETKTQFINQAAHDLGTPLTPIVTLLPIIMARVTDKKVLEQLGVVENNAKYLANILRELINFIKTGATELEYNFKNINLNKLMLEIVENNRPVLGGKNISATTDIPKLPIIYADSQKITELFENLVSNAAKFMPNGGSLKISANATAAYVKVKVKDSGIGMTKKTLSKIFVEFFKADESRHLPGVGLGLSICKRIVEGHGGQIWAESKGIGKGSTIIFRLPVKVNK